MLDMEEATLLAETLGQSAINELKARISNALETHDDTEAMRLDGVLRRVELILGVDGFPDIHNTEH